MVPTPIRSLRLIALTALLFSCEKDNPTPQTEILLIVRTPFASLDTIELVARNINYESDAFSLKAQDRDLQSDPAKLLIRASDTLNGQFLVVGRAILNDAEVAAGNAILEFVPNQRVERELTLVEGFVDNDGDGFAACLAPGCDCNDRDATINPFTAEVCTDYVDHNCNGAPKENCPCLDTDPPLPCSGLPADAVSAMGIGACHLGELRCTDGVLESTCDYGTPQAEIPGNFIDDDCDGSVDEGTACTMGASRACHRGFVDDPSNPDITLRTAATDLARGECQNPSTNGPYGVQSCSNGEWGACEGDVLPERALLSDGTVTAGWAERLANVGLGLPGQCDGLDNDCDGRYDEEPYFDGDQDGYTVCGTTFVLGDPFSQAGRGEEYIDCSDADASINPGQAEVCGNTVDEDCRCDHDPLDRPVGSADSVIGLPINHLDSDVLRCPSPDTYLDCSVAPRSDSAALGVCSEAPNVYFAGFFGPSGANQDCYGCLEVHGSTCDPQTGACTLKADDCATCEAGVPPPAGALYEARPLCTSPGAGCVGNTPPTWAPITGSDPNDECGGVSCAGYYYGLLGNECYERADQGAAAVDCAGAGACETAANVCPSQLSPKGTPVARPTCTYVDGGCVGTTLPTYAPQNNNQDIFNECSSTFDCGPGGGTAFYFGIADTTPDGQTNPQCYHKANVPSSACNGSGSCQSRAQACGTQSAASTTPASGRPLCHFPNGGCTGTTAPVFGNVAEHTDPYDDCGAPASRTCDFASGACHRLQGETCSGDEQCQPGLGLSCIDGVCCAGPCGACEQCQAVTGVCVGITADDGPSCTGPCTSCQAGACTDRPAGATNECTGTCTACDAPGGSCSATSASEGLNCAGQDSVCCAGTCQTLGFTADLGDACGAGDCAGTLECNGASVRCSREGLACADCAGDVPRTGTCTADPQNSACTGLVGGAACTTCTACEDAGTTAACTGTVPSNTEDLVGVNTCTGATGCAFPGGDCACNGSGACLGEAGAPCGDDSHCLSGTCDTGTSTCT